MASTTSDRERWSARLVVTSRAVLAGLGVALLGGLGVAALLLLHQAAPGVLPPCVFHELTGLHCTGCGSTRAAHALVTGNIAHAWAQNPFFVLVLPWVAFACLQSLGRVLFPGRELRGVDVPGRLHWLFAAGVILFSVARNLPFVDFLGPLP